VTRFLLTFLLCASAYAGDPTIVGDPGLRVKVGSPPVVLLTVQGAPENSVSHWAGPIGAGQIGIETRDGLAVAAVAGAHRFLCVLQSPSEGMDPIQVLEVTVVVESSDGTIPPPPPPPVVLDWSAKLTAAVRAKATTADASAALTKVATAYERIADQIKAGSILTSTPEAVRALTSLTSELVPVWEPIESDIVQPHLATLGLTTAAQHEGPWRDIAKAVRAGLTDLPPPVVVDPTPDVLPVSGLHVLIVEEMDSRSTLPASQVSIFTSTELRSWLTTNNAQWRMFDDDVPTDQLEQKWKDALARPRATLPWITLSNGRTGWEGPLPKTVAETITLMEKYR
jgi:hypothetical protein